MASEDCEVRYPNGEKGAPVVQIGTRARVLFNAGSTWAELENGKPISIRKSDLLKWDVETPQR